MDVRTNREVADQQRSPGWLERIGSKRDGLLIGASALYGLGYLVWSIYSLRNGLGLLPALDSQYFIAGMFPAAVIVATYFGLTRTVRTLESWTMRVSSKPKRPTARTLKIIAHLSDAFLFIAVAFFVAGSLRASGDWSSTLARYPFIVLLVLLLVFVAIIGSALGRYRSDDPFHRLYLRFQLGNMFVGGATSLVFLFLFLLYPLIPQELGGVKPRCAYVDVVRAEVSAETLGSLSGRSRPESAEPVVRSSQTEVLYESSSIIWIRSAGTLYELKRDAIHAVIPCR